MPLHPAERLLLAVICAHLLFVAWAFGGTRTWTMPISLGFGVLEILIALWPRNYAGKYVSSGGDFRLLTWPKLLRFPIFWLGLLLVALVVTQALNWRWLYERERGMWWIELRPYKEWLPTSVKAPFEVGGPWPVAMVFTTAWLLVCSAWIGFTRRRTLQILLAVVTTCGFVLGLTGLVQRLSGTNKLLWLVKIDYAAFFASFIYKNHAGAYLNLTLAACVGLAAWFMTRRTVRHERSSPAAVFVFIAVAIAISVLFTYSRGALALTLAFLGLAAIGGAVIFLRQPSATRRWPVVLLIAVFFVGFAALGLRTKPAKLAWERLQTLSEQSNEGFQTREFARKTTVEMFSEFWPRGAGAGCFQFHFREYQKTRPELGPTTGRYPVKWEHAHCDLLQFPLELGLAGTVFLGLMLGYWLLRFVRSGAWKNPVSLSLFAGCGLLLAHAWLDLVFQSPAILLLWCLYWPVMIRWAETDKG